MTAQGRGHCGAYRSLIRSAAEPQFRLVDESDALLCHRATLASAPTGAQALAWKQSGNVPRRVVRQRSSGKPISEPKHFASDLLYLPVIGLYQVILQPRLT